MATRILVTGATGKQGGALINALLSSPSASSLDIFAVTRNTSSPASQALAARKITLIQGDIATSSTEIFSKLPTGPPLTAAFLVTTPAMPSLFGPAAPSEEAQAKPFITAASAAGVKHLVFTSVDRGANADTDPTEIAHFASKFRIEKFLLETSAKGKMQWTILRPVAFMDNYSNGIGGRIFTSMWSSVGERKLQLVSTKDIGKFAAKAILEPDVYSSRAIALAGDELSVEDAQKVFKEVVGREMPVGYWWVGALMMRLIGEVGMMFRWFRDVGYGADVQWCQQNGALNFGEWLRTESGFKEEVAKRN